MGRAGRSSSTLRPQCVASPAASASPATSFTRASAVSSSGAPRQWSATIGPLSSIRTRSRRRSGLSRSRTNCFTRPSQLLKAGLVRGLAAPGSSSSAPCEPA